MVRLMSTKHNQSLHHQEQAINGKGSLAKLAHHAFMLHQQKRAPASPNAHRLLAPQNLGVKQGVAARWRPPNLHSSEYQKHRQRVQNAKSVVDSQAPARFRSRDDASKEPTFLELMESLRRHSRNRTFTKMPESVLQRKGSHMPMRQKRSPTSSTCSANSTFSYKHSCKDRERERDNKSSSWLEIPDHVLQRYQNLSARISYDRSLLRKLLRPKIYFDLEVRGVRPLGRIVIQLFTEACPSIVVEFVRVCLKQDMHRLAITRLFPPLWFEGELALDATQTFEVPNIEHDMRVLDHGSSAGILSFPSRYVRGSKRRYLSFSISFKPLNVLNGKRIAFGRVRRGLWLLDSLQEYGTYNGKPLNEVVISKCGLLH